MAVEQDPTIYSVAREAKVSISTVSRVLNTPHLVTPETRKKVLSAIEKLGYTPKASAQAHAQKNFGRVGVLTPFFRHPSFVQRMRGIASVLAVNSYELVIYPVESFEQIYHYLETVRINRRLDGLITMALPIDATTVKRFQSRSFPVVMIESDHPDLNSIMIDNVDGGRLAAEYPDQERAYRSSASSETATCRIIPSAPAMTVCMVLQKFWKQTDSRCSRSISSSPHPTESTKKLKNWQIRPTALPPSLLPAMNLAMQVLMIARRKGLRVPDDLAVIGFDNLDFASHIGLTTINQQLDESGRIAADLLMSLVRDENIETKPSNCNYRLLKEIQHNARTLQIISHGKGGTRYAFIPMPITMPPLSTMINKGRKIEIERRKKFKTSFFSDKRFIKKAHIHYF